MNDLIKSVQGPPPRFAELLEYHLSLKLQKFAGTGKGLKREDMEAMYALIKEVVHSVFSKSSQNPSDVTKDWIAQRYYEAIKFSDAKVLTDDPDTWVYSVAPVFQEAPIEKIPTSDLRYIAPIFNECVFYEDIEQELRKR
jgi:hypothetical protein